MAYATPPRYQQIADELRQNIKVAIYRVGDRLPPEHELSQRFGVNRHTLRRAMELLRHEGLVRVDRGRGTFVAATPVTYAIGKRVRYNDMLKAQGLTPTQLTLRILEQPATAAIAAALDLSPGEGVVLFERLSLADSQPLSIASSYFPLAQMPNIARHCQSCQSISHMVQLNYGFDHIRQSTRISARTVQPQDAQHLQVPLQSPILLTESVNVNQFDQAIEYGVSRFRADRMELVFESGRS